MDRRVGWLSLFLLLGLGAAWEHTRPEPRGVMDVGPRPGALVCGRVCDARGAEVGGAFLDVDGQTFFWAGETDATGGFCLEGLPPGPHVIEAETRFDARTARVEVTAPAHGVELPLPFEVGP